MSKLNLTADQTGDYIGQPNNLLPTQYKDITTFLDEVTNGTVKYLNSLTMLYTDFFDFSYFI